MTVIVRTVAAALLLVVVGGCDTLFKPPVILLERLKVTEMGLRGPSMDATLRIQNPNPFPVRAEKVTYTITVEGTATDEGVVTEPFTVPAGGERPLVVPIRVPWGAGLGALQAAMGKGVVESKTAGVITVNLWVTSVDVPYTVVGAFRVRDDGAQDLPTTPPGHP